MQWSDENTTIIHSMGTNCGRGERALRIFFGFIQQNDTESLHVNEKLEFCVHFSEATTSTQIQHNNFTYLLISSRHTTQVYWYWYWYFTSADFIFTITARWIMFTLLVYEYGVEISLKKKKQLQNANYGKLTRSPLYEQSYIHLTLLVMHKKNRQNNFSF